MIRSRKRYQEGTVAQKKRANGEHVWIYRYFATDETGKRRRRSATIGTVRKYPTKSEAKGAIGYLRLQANTPEAVQSDVKLFSDAIDRYIAEEMSTRASTRRTSLVWVDNYIRPKWGEVQIERIKPVEVRSWMRSLTLSGKSKGHIHSLMRSLFQSAMLWEWIPVAVNPMSLFRTEGSSKTQKRKIILTVEQFNAILAMIPKEPFRTMVLTAMCIGPRRSEFTALKWLDFNWEKKTLYIRRGIVDGEIGDVKTDYSDQPMPLDDGFAEVLQRWRKQTEFCAEEDWVFASPFVGGEMPYWPNSVNRRYLRAAGEKLGFVGSGPGQRIGWHTLRHTYRAWLDDVGTPIGVMKDLMRHSDIRTTMNVYGGALDDTMREYNGKVVRMALRAS
jgi:integrase